MQSRLRKHFNTGLARAPDLGKSQSHVSTDFSPLGQEVHQVGTAPALSKAQLAAGFHWPEWAEFQNGTSGSIVPHPSE